MRNLKDLKYYRKRVDKNGFFVCKNNHDFDLFMKYFDIVSL